MMQAQTNNAQIKQIFDRIDVAADGADVKFDLALTGPNLEMLLGMLLH